MTGHMTQSASVIGWWYKLSAWKHVGLSRTRLNKTSLADTFRNNRKDRQPYNRGTQIYKDLIKSFAKQISIQQAEIDLHIYKTTIINSLTGILFVLAVSTTSLSISTGSVNLPSSHSLLNWMLWYNCDTYWNIKKTQNGYNIHVHVYMCIRTCLIRRTSVTSFNDSTYCLVSSLFSSWFKSGSTFSHSTKGLKSTSRSVYSCWSSGETHCMIPIRF